MTYDKVGTTASRCVAIPSTVTSLRHPASFVESVYPRWRRIQGCRDDRHGRPPTVPEELRPPHAASLILSPPSPLLASPVTLQIREYSQTTFHPYLTHSPHLSSISSANRRKTPSSFPLISSFHSRLVRLSAGIDDSGRCEITSRVSSVGGMVSGFILRMQGSLYVFRKLGLR